MVYVKDRVESYYWWDQPTMGSLVGRTSDLQRGGRDPVVGNLAQQPRWFKSTKRTIRTWNPSCVIDFSHPVTKVFTYHIEKLKNMFTTFFRWHLQSASLVWWKKLMSWACCATARSRLSSSRQTTNSTSMPALTWTRCCWSILSTTIQSSPRQTRTFWR